MFERKDGLFRGEFGASAPLEIKEVDESGEFEGYGSVFGTPDQGDDIVMPGAFLDSLASIPAPRVKMLWQHKPDTPIGRWLSMTEDEHGLKVHGKLNKKLRAGAEAAEMMLDGIVDGLSIGYRTKRFEINRETYQRKLLQVDLLELSVVTFPMHQSSTISLVKSGNLPTERQFEEYLRDVGFSAKQAKGIIASGYKSITSARDAGDDDAEILSDLTRLSNILRS